MLPLPDDGTRWLGVREENQPPRDDYMLGAQKHWQRIQELEARVRELEAADRDWEHRYALTKDERDRAEATVGRLRGLVIRLTKAIGHSPTCPQAVTRCNCGKAQEIVAAHAEGAYVVRDAALAEAEGE